MAPSIEQFPLWAWFVFGAGLLACVAVDLILHRGSRQRSRAAAVTWTALWIGIGLGFAFVVWGVLGGRRAWEYVTAYLVEKSLSIDNLFVFLVIFRTLGIPHDNQRSVLSWGILGALVFRLGFVLLGVAAIERYQWVLYVFAGVLAWAAVRMVREDPVKAKESKAARWLARHLPVAPELHGGAFFTRWQGRRVVTPLLVGLLAVELTDIVFAVDSVPAALAVSSSRFVVYSSNALAVLGLRSLFVLLEDLIGQLKYLHYGLAAVLGFSAVKLATTRWIEISPILSIGIIMVCIGATIWPSVRALKRLRHEARRVDPAHAA
jgi:TerC family integral membrane protein